MVIASSNTLRLPKEYRKSLLRFEDRRGVSRILRQQRLSTVCEEARCPNIGECFSQNTATFMIMGDRCTRRCHFCSVTTKKPLALDPFEPQKVADAVRLMGLDYVVITSVDRDELPDHGAGHFAHVVKVVKENIPHAQIEVLTPDFRGKPDLVNRVLASPIDVFGHNIESVERLYKSLRPQSDFRTTQSVLAHAARSGVVVKSGLMVGVGERDEEVFETLDTLKDLGVAIVTIGQYLRPSLKHWPVDRFVSDQSFNAYCRYGKEIGLQHVFAGPFVRSSYQAKEAHIKAFSA